MQIEKRVDGAQVVRPGLGRQRLLVASTHPAEVVVVCDLEEVISCNRHHDENLKKTVPCTCTGPCYSQRTDRFVAVLYRTGPTLWEERVLVLPANGWGSMMSTMLNKHLDHSDIRGLRMIVQRRGDSINGRTTADVQDRVKSIPGGFDLKAGVRNTTGIAADFFGDSDGELFAKEEPPARTRQDKPRTPLGKKHGG
jgi:hypothetical protein